MKTLFFLKDTSGGYFCKKYFFKLKISLCEKIECNDSPDED